MRSLNHLRAFIFAIVLLFINQSYSQNVSLNFDGKDDYVVSNYPGISGTSARTVEAWIKTSANCDPNKGGVQNVITDWGTYATGSRFTFNVLFGNAIRIEVQGSGLNGKKAINDGKWHHVAAIYDPSATLNYRLLVDGQLDTAGNISTSINTGTTVPLTIGKRIDNINLFNGEIDEVRVFNFARTDSEIKTEMGKEYCSLPSGLVAYYKLNEGNPGSSNKSQTTAIDYSKGKNNGTLSNFNLSGSSSNWVNGTTLTGGNTKSTLKIFECYEYLVPSGKNRYFFSGTYTDTIANSAKCDSIITIFLTIGNSNLSFQVSGCDSFVTPSGNTIKSSGLYLESFKTAKGCDSSIEYDVTINNSFLKNNFLSSCDSVKTPNGKVFYKDTVLVDKFKNSAGCDSVIKYFITVNKSFLQTDTVTECDSAKIRGKWYFNSQTLQFKFKSKKGCDSVYVLILRINKSFVNKTTAKACNQYVSKGGITYTATGNYKEVYKTTKGCDSTLLFDLTITSPKFFNDTLKSCGPVTINGSRYDLSGDYTQKLTSKAGCDSILNINLTVVKIDTTVSRVGNKLTASQTGAAYLWFDCDNKSIISGATTISYTATKNGNFAAIIKLNGCEDTSNCHRFYSLDVQKFDLQQLVKIWPNPNSGKFKCVISPELKSNRLVITDVSGRKVFERNIGLDEVVEIDTDLSSGIYYLSIENQSGIINKLIDVR
jgi:hypothetical protein